MARTPEKFVQPLAEEDRKALQHLRDKGETRRIRQRAHAILLSDSEKSIGEISEIFEVRRETVSSWLDRWDTEGLTGLADKPRSGSPPTLNESEKKQVIKLIDKHPHSPKQVLQQVQQKLGKSISRRTLRRLARASGRRWKRMRRSLKSQRDEDDFQQAQQELKELQEAHRQGEFDLFYMDEAGFSLVPSVPYAWQRSGEQRELPSRTSRRANTLGFLGHDGDCLVPYTFEGAIDSASVIACIDDFCDSLARPACIVTDNASVHTCGALLDRLDDWEKRGLFFYFLPPYCPELNLIEVLWRMIKYHWLPLSAYDAFDDLLAALQKIFTNFGSRYCIQFAD